MKNKYRWLKVIATIIVIIVGIILFFAVYNRIAISFEAKEITANGRLVEVGDYKIHVYAEGEKSDEPTLVFMSGSATVAPVYDFKMLYSLLSDDYRIVVVEKLGYGYSDIVDTKRDVESMVEETREALKLAGEEAPFVLVPHSMSGLEALYWAQNYPEEVKAVIGLDMAIPASYDAFDMKRVTRMITVGRTAAKLGILRIPGLYPLNSEALSAEERRQQKLLMYRNAVNIDYIREGEYVLNNAQLVREGGSISCPVLMFSSNGEEIGDYWLETQKQFAEDTDSKLIIYDCGHYIHYDKHDEIANEIRQFLNGF